MKKIIALALAILMMAAIAVPAMATKGYDATSTGDGYNESIVELGVSGGYTVTIPQKIVFDAQLKGTATVSVASAILAGNETLAISVSSDNWQFDEDGDEVADYDAWVMVDTAEISAPVDYTIKNGEEDVENDDVILEVDVESALTGEAPTSGYKGSVTLSLSTPGTSQVGVYQDVLTFAASIVTPENNG